LGSKCKSMTIIVAPHTPLKSCTASWDHASTDTTVYDCELPHLFMIHEMKSGATNSIVSVDALYFELPCQANRLTVDIVDLKNHCIIHTQLIHHSVMYSWNIHLSPLSVFIYFLRMVLTTFLNSDVINQMNMWCGNPC
jgi:hypothetical protein